MCVMYMFCNEMNFYTLLILPALSKVSYNLNVRVTSVLVVTTTSYDYYFPIIRLLFKGADYSDRCVINENVIIPHMKDTEGTENLNINLSLSCPHG